MSTPPSPTRIISALVLFVTGAVLLDLSWVLSNEYIEPLGDAFRLAVVWALYGISFAYLIAAVVGLDSARAQRRLLTAALVILALAFGSAFLRRVGYENLGTDAVLFSRYAVDLVLAGGNPYAHAMSPAFDAYPTDVGFVTYTEDGTVVTSLSYPALSFLLFVPQVLAGIDNLNVTPMAVVFAVVIVLVRHSPPWLASLPLALLFANLNLVRFSHGGVFDILWVLPLLFAMRFWAAQRWRAAAFCFGLACAVKQTPWLIAPYLGLWLYLESPDRRTFLTRARDCLLFGGGAFLLPNLPFLVADPGAWLRGVLTPLGTSAPLVMQGSGLVLLEASGVTEMSRSFFTLALALVLLATLALYALYFARLRWLAWIAPMLLMWFHARSLQNYFIYFVPVAYYAFLQGGLPGASTPLPSTAPAASRWPSWLVDPRRRAHVAMGIAGTTIVALVTAGLLFGSASRLGGGVALVGGHDPDHLGRVSELELTVTNGGRHPLAPVFDIVRHGHSTRFAWDTVGGPPLLAPGESADYRIGTGIHAAMLDYGAAFIVTVRDRSSRLTTKSDTLVVKPPRAREQLVRNPRFALWEAPASAQGLNPVGWSASISAPSAETRVSRVADGVSLAVREVERTQPGPWTMAGVTQRIPFPRTLRIELTPTTLLPHLTVNPRAATGIEIADEDRRVWIIPTRTAARTTRYRGGTLEYVFVFVPARTGERLVADVDLEAIYRERDWPLPRDSDDATAQILLFAAVYPGGDAAREVAAIVFHAVEAVELSP